MSSSPMENLEIQAIQQRNQLHNSADELRAKIEEGKQKLSLTRQSREHFAAAAILISLIGFGLGFSLAGQFTDK